jgi:hypothetical protein
VSGAGPRMFGGWAALLLLAVSFTSLFIHYLLKK